MSRVPIICEAVQESKLFDRTFDALLAIGLMFLPKAEDQRRLISLEEEYEDEGENHYFDAFKGKQLKSIASLNSIRVQRPAC